MVKKMIILGLVLIMCLGIFSGCGDNKYNAKLYYNAQGLMNTEYLEANMTLDARDLGVSVSNKELPETITNIIKSKEEFDIAFREFPQEVDFNIKMLLVHFFTSSYSTSPYKLKKVKMYGNNLHINFKLNKSRSFFGRPDAGLPLQTCIVVIIDKIDVDTAIFKL